MSYQITKSNGETIIILDGTQDTTTTSLTLIGRKSLNYGQLENQNIVRLLENFAYSLPPTNSIIGQLWYNTTTGQINVYDGRTWSPQASTGYVDTAITNALIANLSLQNGNFSGSVVANSFLSNAAIYSTTGFFYKNGTPYYANSNVAAYLPGDSTIVQLQTNATQLQANITAANAAIITANAGVISYVNSQITTINANATSQETEISSLNANITAANVAIASLQSNPVYGNANVAVYLPYNATITTIQANISAANVAIASLQNNPIYGNANVAVYLPYDSTIIGIVQTNVNQEAEITGLRANITAANVAIASLQSNPVYGNANVAVYLPYDSTITGLRASITAANVAWTANASFQETEITSLRANITAANTAISTINTISGNVLNVLVSNVSRFVYISNVAPISSQGNIGDIWYQIF
jgi:hypothetical protein